METIYEYLDTEGLENFTECTKEYVITKLKEVYSIIDKLHLVISPSLSIANQEIPIIDNDIIDSVNNIYRLYVNLPSNYNGNVQGAITVSPPSLYGYISDNLYVYQSDTFTNKTLDVKLTRNGKVFKIYRLYINKPQYVDPNPPTPGIEPEEVFETYPELLAKEILIGNGTPLIFDEIYSAQAPNDTYIWYYDSIKGQVAESNESIIREGIIKGKNTNTFEVHLTAYVHPYTPLSIKSLQNIVINPTEEVIGNYSVDIIDSESSNTASILKNNNGQVTVLDFNSFGYEDSNTINLNNLFIDKLQISHGTNPSVVITVTNNTVSVLYYITFNRVEAVSDEICPASYGNSDCLNFAWDSEFIRDNYDLKLVYVSDSGYLQEDKDTSDITSCLNSLVVGSLEYSYANDKTFKYYISDDLIDNYTDLMSPINEDYIPINDIYVVDYNQFNEALSKFSDECESNSKEFSSMNELVTYFMETEWKNIPHWHIYDTVDPKALLLGIGEDDTTFPEKFINGEYGYPGHGLIYEYPSVDVNIPDGVYIPFNIIWGENTPNYETRLNIVPFDNWKGDVNNLETHLETDSNLPNSPTDMEEPFLLADILEQYKHVVFEEDPSFM